MKLSENFTYDEFIRSSTAARLGINNSMKTHEIIRAQKLCMKILQPLRGMACEPVHISSGFRCPELNKAVYGSKTSQHMKAEAADIHINSLTVQQICKLIIDMDLPYHQLIDEFSENGQGWVHVSIAPEGQEPRRQYMTARRGRDGKTIYNTISVG